MVLVANALLYGWPLQLPWGSGADNSVYAVDKWETPRLLDKRGRAIAFEKEQGIYDHGSYSTEIRFSDDGYPPMAPTEGNKALLARLNQVNATLGLPEMPAGDPANRGAGDISFVAFIDGLVGLGMAGEGSHAPGETADLKSLDVQAKRAALLMSRLAKEPRPKAR